MSSELPLGIVGCGRIVERAYLPALRRVDRIRLAAVADPRAERRRLIAAGVPGCTEHACIEELLKNSEVAAVVVATPSFSHAEVAAQALAAGVPVLIEKPLARAASDVAGFAERVAQAGDGAVMVAFNRRFWEPVRRLRGAVLAGELGESATARLRMTGDIRAWSSVEERSDALCDLAAHQFDLLRYLFGCEIAAVRARWVDSLTIRIDARLEGGVRAECFASHAGRAQETIQVAGERAGFEVQRGSERIAPEAGVARSALDGIGTAVRRLRRQRSSLRRSFDRQLAAFADCVRSGGALEPAFADGLAALRAVDAARTSAASGASEVAVPQ